MPDPTDPQTLNRYSYVLNNPLRYTDPTGHYYDLCPECGGFGQQNQVSQFEALFGEPAPTLSLSTFTLNSSVAETARYSATFNSFSFLNFDLSRERPLSDPFFAHEGAGNLPFVKSRNSNQLANAARLDDNFGLSVGRIFTEFNPLFSAARTVAGLVTGNDPFTREEVSLSPLPIAIGVVGSLGRIPAGISNPIPETLARVIDARKFNGLLGPSNRLDVFVTDANAIRNLDASALAQRLNILPAPSFRVIEFPSRGIYGIASPIRRSDPGFIGGGRTRDGLPEFVIPNALIPKDSRSRIVR